MASRALEDGDYLYVMHRREPHLLYPLLEKNGYEWRCREGGPSGYEIYIWRAGDRSAGDEVRKACSC